MGERREVQLTPRRIAFLQKLQDKAGVDLGQAIPRWRHEEKLTVVQVAEKLGIHRITAIGVIKVFDPTPVTKSESEKRKNRTDKVIAQTFGPDPEIELQKLVDEGLTDRAIGKRVRRSHEAIKRWRAKLDIKPHDESVEGSTPTPDISQSTSSPELEKSILLAVMGTDPKGLLKILIEGGASNEDIARSLGAGKVSAKTVDELRGKYGL